MEVFLLDDHGAYDNLLPWSDETRFITEICPFNPNHSRRQRRSHPLHVVAPVHLLTDFEWTVYGECLVGPDIRDSFVRANVSGIGFREVVPHLTTGEPFGREIFEMQVFGSGGTAPPESGITVIESCA